MIQVYVRMWVSEETLEDDVLSIHASLKGAEAACDEEDFVVAWDLLP